MTVFLRTDLLFIDKTCSECIISPCNLTGGTDREESICEGSYWTLWSQNSCEMSTTQVSTLNL